MMVCVYAYIIYIYIYNRYINVRKFYNSKILENWICKAAFKVFSRLIYHVKKLISSTGKPRNRVYRGWRREWEFDMSYIMIQTYPNFAILSFFVIPAMGLQGLRRWICSHRGLHVPNFYPCGFEIAMDPMYSRFF